MTWPDDNLPRYLVDAHPSVRVLDRAYAYRVVREFTIGFGRPRSYFLAQAAALAAVLNAEDADTSEAA